MPADDAGRREMIGLAAPTQIVIIPTWIGASLGLGTADVDPGAEVWRRSLNFVVNIALVVVSSTAACVLLGAIRPSLRKLRSWCP